MKYAEEPKVRRVDIYGKKSDAKKKVKRSSSKSQQKEEKGHTIKSFRKGHHQY